MNTLTLIQDIKEAKDEIVQILNDNGANLPLLASILTYAPAILQILDGDVQRGSKHLSGTVYDTLDDLPNLSLIDIDSTPNVVYYTLPPNKSSGTHLIYSSGSIALLEEVEVLGSNVRIISLIRLNPPNGQNTIITNTTNNYKVWRIRMEKGDIIRLSAPYSGQPSNIYNSKNFAEIYGNVPNCLSYYCPNTSTLKRLTWKAPNCNVSYMALNNCRVLSYLDINWTTPITTSFNNAFSSLNIDTIPSISLMLVGNSCDLQLMFNLDYNLTEIVFNENFCNSAISGKLNSTFGNCYKLQKLVLPKYLDTSKVTEMNSTFASTYILKNLELPKNFGNQAATNINSMFARSGIQLLILPSGFTCENVTNMNYLFEGSTRIKKIQFPDTINTSKVTTMYCMFNNCRSLEEVNFPSGFSNINCAVMQGMFSNCHSLLEITFPETFTCENVTTIIGMFTNCHNLRSIKFPDTLNISKITSLNNIFNACYSLEELDLSGFNTKNVTNVTNFGSQLNSLKTIKFPNNDNFDLSKVTSMGWFLTACYALTKIEGKLSGIKCNWDCRDLINIDHDSALVIINALDLVSDNRILLLAPLVKEKLTSEDIAIATDKGWTIT